MRKSYDEFFIDVARLIGTRSTCDRGHTGCVIVKNRQVISTGFAGAPQGLAHCDDIGHEMENNHCVRTTHSEINAIINAARHGVSTDGSTLYCTMVPCYACAKAIINAGIKRVVTEFDYHDAVRSKDILFLAGIDLIIFKANIHRYDPYEIKEKKFTSFFPIIEKTRRRKPLQGIIVGTVGDNRREQPKLLRRKCNKIRRPKKKR